MPICPRGIETFCVVSKDTASQHRTRIIHPRRCKGKRCIIEITSWICGTSLQTEPRQEPERIFHSKRKSETQTFGRQQNRVVEAACMLNIHVEVSNFLEHGPKSRRTRSFAAETRTDSNKNVTSSPATTLRHDSNSEMGCLAAAMRDLFILFLPACTSREESSS